MTSTSASLFVGLEPSTLSTTAKWEILKNVARQLGIQLDTQLGVEQSVISGGEVHGSYPLNLPHAKELYDGLNPDSQKLLRALAEGYSSESQRGSIPWPTARKIMSDRSWADFARGPLSGMTRRLRNIVGDPSAVLVITSDEHWDWDEQIGDYTNGSLIIDGPAILSLRSFFQI